MVVAGVLIQTAPGKCKDVLKALRETEGIRYAYAVFGRYDIVATITEAKDLDAVAEIVTEKIAKVPGVAGTETLIAAHL
jgi:DNA-binding Lrp family transcriptional regulator